MTFRSSIVITAYNEATAIVRPLESLIAAVTIPSEIIVVVDSDDDTTIPFVDDIANRCIANSPHSLRIEVNSFGRGPSKAIRFGFFVAKCPVVVVTMADGCDDPYQIDELIRLVERGVVIAAASRYSRGGQQIGAPRIKGILSRVAGMSLKLFANVGTWDATNSFKAYSKEFVERVNVESDKGFEVGIELVSKARRLKLPVAEVPTVWLERTTGTSNFKIIEWLPRYLKWYLFAFGVGSFNNQDDSRNV